MDGWLNIYKPIGISSAAVVAKLKKLLDFKGRIGHCGTLDPLADGVLPIALGQATKLVDYVMGGEKTYLFTIQFGSQTTTADSQGEVISQTDIVPTSLQQLQDVCKVFIGKITQHVPKYSAIKISGIPSYKLARAGVDVPIKSRQITISKMQLLESDFTNHTATYQVTCSKGTYVRALAEDIATSLKSLGFVIRLTRLAVKGFCGRKSLALQELLNLENAKQILHSSLLPIESVLCDILSLDITKQQAVDVLHGKQILLQHKDLDLVWLRYNGRLLTIGSLLDKKYNIFRNFNFEI